MVEPHQPIQYLPLPPADYLCWLSPGPGSCPVVLLVVGWRRARRQSYLAASRKG
jgi:hypothetical protein